MRGGNGDGVIPAAGGSGLARFSSSSVRQNHFGIGDNGAAAIFHSADDSASGDLSENGRQTQGGESQERGKAKRCGHGQLP